MWKNRNSWAPRLGKKNKRGFRGYPIATVALYGPTSDFATKVVVTVAAKPTISSTSLRASF
jgi:hypothetical protein